MATASTGGDITLEYRGTVAIIKLNIPKKLNALAQPGYFQIAQYLREVAERDDIYVTVITGEGRFFSAGADVGVQRDYPPDKNDKFNHLLQTFAANNINTTHAFYTHPKILVVALNGPVVGLSAALVGWADFVYAAPHTYLLLPFSSLGLVSEGVASIGLVQRLGIAKAKEALIQSKRLTCEELVHTGFVTKVFDTQPNESDKFLELVLAEINDRMGPHLNQDSMIRIKALIRKPDIEKIDAQSIAEVYGGIARFMNDIPQQEFAKVASGQKRHKL